MAAGGAAGRSVEATVAAKTQGRASPRHAQRVPEGRSKALGRRVHARRIACDLSVTALADAAGLSAETVRLFECGDRDVAAADYGAMARVLRLVQVGTSRSLSPARALHLLAAEELAFEDALVALAALARVHAARRDDQA
jgi:transcriptional regulator with XRE-family HTH domain